MNIPYETPRDLKSRYGHFAYLVEGAKTFINPTPLYELSYIVDGKEHKGEYSFMLITNANRVAGINNFYKNIKLDDDKFEVLLCNLTKKSDIVRSLYYFATSNIASAKGFEFLKVSEMQIKFNDNAKADWCIDGEKLEDDTSTYNIKMINDFEILMPKKNISKLFIEK